MSLQERGFFTIDDFLTEGECRDFIQQSESIGFLDATINTAGGTQREESVRNNSRVLLDDPILASHFWVRVRDYIPQFLDGRQAIGVNERFRFYRYGPTQSFSLHADGAFRRANGEESRLTLIVYLNEDFEGGETAFLDSIVVPRTGRALIFRHEVPHEGRAVKHGLKYALRSDIMFNPIGRLSTR